MKGLSISPGYALGKIYCLKHFQLDNLPTETIAAGDTEAEIERFKVALDISRNEITQMLDMPQIKSSAEISSIFQAHLTLIDDPDLSKEITKRIKEQQQDCQSAVSKVIRDYSTFFRNLPDPQFQSKAIDILDIGKRILKNCQKSKNPTTKLEELEEGMIVLAEDLTPSDMMTLDPSRILGIAIEEGTSTSHAAIMARSLGIPALIQVKDLMKKAKDGVFAIIDGSSEQIILNPDAKLKRKYAAEYKEYLNRQRKMYELLSEPSITKDGVEILLKANVGQLSDIEQAVKNKAYGVGLYRTEFAYLTRRTFPTENELYETYLEAATKLNGNPMVIRTIDLGGDKISHLTGNNVEQNPELGWRAIRISLECKELFITQLRAILRTAASAKKGQVSILFPMISSMEELTEAKNILAEVKKQMQEEGIAVPKELKIGMMMEVPSTAIMADIYAKEVDFFAIGSNDLVQYTLAVDRTNPRVTHLYKPTNPAVLYLIKHIVDAATRNNVGLCICGEIAGDIKYTIMLLGLGIRELSMNAVLIPAVKNIIRNISYAEIQKLIAPLLNMKSSTEIEAELNKLNTKLGLL
ncbi:MAG: phosphoenolpyruvate--protein phosphotransferase [Candidatus Riflebacteria bacterium]|nr:phosphoenolpyruvate--protein phosphotransferase [Candidatus Riflebacteria bacterium]